MTTRSLRFSRLLTTCSIVLLVVNCGGGGGGAGGAFCHDYAAALCHKMVQCPPQGGNPFPSEADCTAGLTKMCTDSPPADTTVDINCSGGKQVNSAAETKCLGEIASATCDQFNSDSYTNSCDQVCTTPTGAGGASGAGGGVGGSGAGGGVGGMGAGGSAVGGAGGSGDAQAVAFCGQLWGIACDLAYKCFSATDRSSATFVQSFDSSLANCKGATLTAQRCSTVSCNGPYDASAAQTCSTKYAASSCTDALAGVEPAECATACP